MADTIDMELMRQYAEDNSESAFAELVQRHINLVHSVAWRFTGNSSDAQDVTQAVFVILHKKISDLRQRKTLTGWLYETTRLTAHQFLRTRSRQQTRDHEAYMESILQQPNNETVWKQVAPVLEEAMARLNEKDRTLLALRFFENKTLAETAALLGIEEWAARKRASRVVEKLQKFFSLRGINSTAEAITGALSTNAIQPAPALLAKTIAAVALSKGAAVSTSTLTLTKGVLKIMAWTKTKIAIATGVMALAAVGTTTIAFNVWFFNPSVDDVFKHATEPKYLQHAPPATVLRPTQYANQGSWINGDDKRFLGRNRSMPWVLAAAYNIGPERMILPVDLPTGGFDYLISDSTTPRNALQDALKKQFGLVAHTEMRTTNVLVLKVSDAGTKNLKVNPQTGKDSILIEEGKVTLRDFSMSFLAASLAGYFVNAPIVDETGLTKNYDITLRWKGNINNPDAMSQILQNELGLELVPDKREIEMLVVEFQDGPTDYTPRAGSDLQGYWLGTETWGGNPWPVALKITEPSDGNFRAQFRNMWFSPQFAAASAVTYDPPKVRIEFPSPARVFEGEINRSHTEIVGALHYVNTNANNTPYPMTVKLSDPKEDAALEAQKDFHNRDENDLAGHWTATMNNDEWKLDIAHLPENKITASLTPPGWSDGIGDTMIQNGPNVRIEFAYKRMATFIGKMENGKLIGTMQIERKGTPQPITFERNLN